MALILAFRAAPARNAVQPAQSAELIIFPGIRYERHADAAQPTAKSGRSRRAKTRELIDLMD